MSSIAQTKRLLIREAIQDNIHPQRRSKPAESRPVRHVSLWIWSMPLIGLLAFFLPPRVASTANSPSPDESREQTAVASILREPPPVSQVVKAAEIPKVTAVPQQAIVPERAPQRLNRELFPLSARKVVIDAGHGGTDHGAISDSGVSEKEITLDVALRLQRLLEEASFEVVMTRDSDQNVPLEKRAAIANTNSADLFVSIHVNWIQPLTLRTLETYFLGPTQDPLATKLVALENSGSTYPLSEYRRLLEKIYIDARREESRRFATSIQTGLYRSLKQINPALEDRGVKTAPFIVLTRTNMPAILVEVSCLSNAQEVELLANAEYKESIAQAFLTGIRSYAKNLGGSDKGDEKWKN